MKFAGINKNDLVDGKDICVSFWFQGCPFKCDGCHNPQTWDFNGGTDLPENYLEIIDNSLTENGIQRNLSLLGGEPFCEQNKQLLKTIVFHVRQKFPDILILAWTGNWYEELIKDQDFKMILDQIDYLIDGPFELDKRDVTLKWRGSTNQRILKLK